MLCCAMLRLLHDMRDWEDVSHEQSRITAMPVSIVKALVMLTVWELAVAHVVCVREVQLICYEEVVGPVEDAVILAIIHQAAITVPACNKAAKYSAA